MKVAEFFFKFLAASTSGPTHQCSSPRLFPRWSPCSAWCLVLQWSIKVLRFQVYYTDPPGVCSSNKLSPPGETIITIIVTTASPTSLSTQLTWIDRNAWLSFKTLHTSWKVGWSQPCQIHRQTPSKNHKMIPCLQLGSDPPVRSRWVTNRSFRRAPQCEACSRRFLT